MIGAGGLAKLRGAGFALLVFVSALGVASGVLAHGVTVKLHHALAADSVLHTQFIVPWAQRLDQASAGHLRFQLSPASPLEASALLAQVRDGVVDIACVAIAPTGAFPLFEQFKAQADRGEQASSALWDYVRANDVAKQEFSGLRLLAVAAAGKAASQGERPAPMYVVVMNPALFKSLTDDVKQAVNANSGAEVSAWLGKALDAAGK